MSLPLALLWALLIVWLLLRAIRQLHAYQVLEPGAVAGKGSLPPVSVVVPARNEAGNIAACVGGLTAQDYPGKVEVVVVDDDSTDGTAFIARKACKARRGFRVAAAGRLPDGWTGKSHACWQGARQTAGEWLCFLDADFENKVPGHVRRSPSEGDAPALRAGPRRPGRFAGRARGPGRYSRSARSR